jgi:cytochrome c biogenesis protein CcmG/thiol:disulfide interchange protein DsbE
MTHVDDGQPPVPEPDAPGDDALDGALDDGRLDDDGGLGGGRTRRTALIVSAVVAVLAIGFVWMLGTSEAGTDREATSPLLGKVAPALSGTTLDGEVFDIDDHRGEWVVVNVFATWCRPCVEEHPELVAFDQAHRDAGDATLVSVLFDDRPSTARRYFEDNGGEWPVVVDGEGRIATDYGVSGVPETYLVAPDGRVAAKLIGGVTAEGLDRVIAEASGSGSAGSGSGSEGGS